MYELVQIGEKTYYINSPSKVGIYKIDEEKVCLIDSGNDKDAAKKILKILDEQGWKLEMILNTHSHADHIGGNKHLQDKTGCKIYCPSVERAFTEYTELEPSFLYGGYPFKELRNKFLCAKASSPLLLTEDALPSGMEMISLQGHSFDMVAFKTEDKIWFLADSLTSEKIIEKYHISFLYNLEKYLESLDKVTKLEGEIFIPSHGEPVSKEEIVKLAEINKDKTYEIIQVIKDICAEPVSFDNLLKAIFDKYNLKMDPGQYVLLGSTVKSYLTYLKMKKEIDILIEDNILKWTVC